MEIVVLSSNDFLVQAYVMLSLTFFPSSKKGKDLFQLQFSTQVSIHTTTTTVIIIIIHLQHRH